MSVVSKEKQKTISYGSPQLWQATLYRWIQLTDSNRKQRQKVINNIMAACSANLESLRNLVDGTFSESTEETLKLEQTQPQVEYYGPYIRFPNISFEIDGINCLSQIRINPCISFDHEIEHFSKIWVIISTDKGNFTDMDTLNRVFQLLKFQAAKLEKQVKALYIEQAKIPIPKAKKRWTITAKSFGIDGPKNKEVAKLFSNDPNDVKNILRNHLTATILGDVLSLNYMKKISSPRQVLGQLDWNLASSNGTKLLYGRRNELKNTFITGVANTSDSDEIHNLFRPISIRIANSL
ncbi:MAG: hypothetical protein Q8K92_17905 [Leadbetterella sp.]|nr:hypothetical protein [Leadbetterella sp.]